ncbi:UNVERIFIED_CONTAM: hypothetical protein Sindi_2560200 [Sesamum indicum]
MSFDYTGALATWLSGRLHERVVVLHRELGELLTRKEITRTENQGVVTKGRGSKRARASTRIRQQKNTITQLRDGNGNWNISREDLHRIILEHYREIYRSSQLSVEDIDVVLKGLSM